MFLPSRWSVELYAGAVHPTYTRAQTTLSQFSRYDQREELPLCEFKTPPPALTGKNHNEFVLLEN